MLWRSTLAIPNLRRQWKRQTLQKLHCMLLKALTWCCKDNKTIICICLLNVRSREGDFHKEINLYFLVGTRAHPCTLRLPTPSRSTASLILFLLKSSPSFHFRWLRLNIPLSTCTHCMLSESKSDSSVYYSKPLSLPNWNANYWTTEEK